MSHNGPFLLCILDGFGLSEKTEGNAILAAKTPFWDSLIATYPHAQLRADGPYVGLPEGQMGNSEVGHMTIGAGRIMRQNLQRIEQDFKNNVIQKTNTWKQLESSIDKTRAVHIFALISDGGVHSHTNHIVELIKNIQSHNKSIFIHIITDGRDTEPYAAKEQLESFQKKLTGYNNVHLASIGGRFFAMDRDNRWDRIQQAYTIFTQKSVTTDINAVLSTALQDELTDEFIKPQPLKLETDENPLIQNDDTLIFANFRADRMRQLVRSFIEPIDALEKQSIFPKNIFTMTEYDKSFENHVQVLFPPEQPKNTLGEIIEASGGKQLRIAESEKYAHVTFFLNGGREEPFDQEDRIVIPSPKVKTYDLAPEMSLPEVTKQLLSALDHNYELIVLNIANGDQVGHSGNFKACVQAIESVDKALSKLIPEIKARKGEILIIADHGNCEEMHTEKGGMHTAHTTNPVPLVYIGRNASVKQGGLADVAPTILTLLHKQIPSEMTGKSLVEVKS